MKKFIYIKIVLLILIASLVACDNANKITHNSTDTQPNLSASDNYITSFTTSIWNGNIADGYESGDGSNESPYIIADASQLAYLAEQTNSGISTIDKYFSLACDIDLNNIEWTPIGNGTNYFAGTFNGNEHTIYNLKITIGTLYDKIQSVNTPNKTTASYASGLFGTCIDTTIIKLKIFNTNLKIQGITDRQSIYAGILCGNIYTYDETYISNIKIFNSKITTDFKQDKMPLNLYVGGTIGYINHFGSSNGTYEQIQTNVEISIENGTARYNCIGGLIGYLGTNNTCNIENACSYLSVKINNEDCYTTDNFIGALGGTLSSDKTFSMYNIYSAVEIDKVYDDVHGYPAYTAYAIIGEAFYVADKNATAPSGYKNENIFGYIKQTDEIKNNTQYSLQLYNYPNHAVYTETNCFACQLIPENNNLDLLIWDLTDTSQPKIK